MDYYAHAAKINSDHSGYVHHSIIAAYLKRNALPNKWVDAIYAITEAIASNRWDERNLALSYIKHTKAYPVREVLEENKSPVPINGLIYAIPDKLIEYQKRNSGYKQVISHERLKKKQVLTSEAEEFIIGMFQSPKKELKSLKTNPDKEEFLLASSYGARSLTIHSKNFFFGSFVSKFSAQGVIANRALSSWEEIDDCRVAKINGWPRKCIKPEVKAPPEEFWCAYDNHSVSITKTRSGALRGLKTRTGNKIGESLWQ